MSATGLARAARLSRDAPPPRIYEDPAAQAAAERRPMLEACLAGLVRGERVVLVVFDADRGRALLWDLVAMAEDLGARVDARGLDHLAEVRIAGGAIRAIPVTREPRAALAGRCVNMIMVDPEAHRADNLTGGQFAAWGSVGHEATLGRMMLGAQKIGDWED